jgi:hypothetical protein
MSPTNATVNVTPYQTISVTIGTGLSSGQIQVSW